MKKKDLVNGAIVKLRNGNKYMLLFDTNRNGEIDDLFINLHTGWFTIFSNYNEDLTYAYTDEEYDVVAVYQSSYVGENFIKHIIKEEDTWTWERGEAKEMTVAEISKALGYDVKVVK